MTRKVLIGAVAAVVVASGVFAAGGAGILFQAMFRASGTGAVDRAAMLKLRDVVSVKDFGATGDGTTDDTAAIQAALTTGKNVFGVPGDTYLVAGGLTQSAAGQVIDMTGAIVKLKNSAGSKGVLRLNGAGSRVVGGEWDMNQANNLSDAASGFSTWAVLLAADRTVAEKMYVHDSYGLAIKGLAGINHAEARFNRIVNAGTINNGLPVLYFDNPAGDVFGNKVFGNFIDVSASNNVSGIGIYSTAPFTVGQRSCSADDNEVIGTTSAGSNQPAAVTVRGIECTVSRNRISGFGLGVTVDLSQETRSTVVGNVILNPNGTTAFGIEVNGGKSVVSSNYVDGGRYGFSGTAQNQSAATMDDMVIVNNIFKNPTVGGIFLQPASSITAHSMVIAGNQISQSTAGAMQGINIGRDCIYTLISGNSIVGPGSGNAGSRGVFMDSVNGDVTISGNRFDGWERAVAVYNTGAVAQNRIQFIGNDVSHDIGSSAGSVLLNLEGSATWGTGVRVSGNTRGSAASLVDDELDRAGSIRFVQDSSFTTPESNVTAGIGSVYISTANGRLWTKIAGTGNTGWSGLTDRGTITLSVGTGTAASIVGSFCVCTDSTANASVKCSLSAGTLTATGTGSDVITYICVK